MVGFALDESRLDLAAPDKILNLTQKDENLFAAANLMCS